MALNIKDPETDRLARELARLTGESITVSLRRAVEQRLEVERRRRAARPELREIIERGRSRPMLDSRTAEEILGYDADGLAR